MNDHSWVRISPRRSWHAVRTPTRMVNAYRTLCGRTVVTLDAPADELPGDEKSCERCAVIAVKADEQP